MLSNDTAHRDDDPVHRAPDSDAATDSPEAASSSAVIVRWLPLLAANDFLEQDDNLPPVA